MTYTIGNLYSLDDDPHKAIMQDIRHFQHKHDCCPNVVLIHPDCINGLTGELEYEDEHGNRLTLTVRADVMQLHKSYMLMREE